MSYVSVWAVGIPNANKQKWIDQCKIMAPIFKENGALAVVDCWGDEVPDGEITSFPMAVKKGDGETVAIGYVVWPDKETRNKGMDATMSDSRISDDMFTDVFDGKKIIFGDFEVVNEA